MAVEIDTKRTFISILNKEAWYDPRLLSVVTAVRTTEVQLNGTTPQAICAQDTTRLMLGVMNPNSAGSVLISPFPDPNAFAFSNLNLPVLVEWYKIFDYGPIIFNSWYAFGSNKIRVVEVYRTDGK